MCVVASCGVMAVMVLILLSMLAMFGDDAGGLCGQVADSSAMMQLHSHHLNRFVTHNDDWREIIPSCRYRVADDCCGLWSFQIVVV